MGSYQLLEAIGKGGFGVVYRGLNLLTGATVAVKRVNLTGIPKEELEGLETEISLLKNLSHPNIVKYIDAVRMEEYLNIILEFVENGSLSVLLGKLSKRGTVEEQLVAVYTTQILEGLRYLHEQGVIHRDIKGANILLTKEGVVKLADFGVATSLTDSKKSDSVVGTPYWMAPEIIEMTGQQSSACDIWSVGCTVVELLTGKPPYFDLQQMPALFRIVQDEHPPLPENVSPALTDFLLQCFQKDPLRRISATDLLRHPWLKQAQTTRRKELKLKMKEKKTHRQMLEHAKTLGVPVPSLDVEEIQKQAADGSIEADSPTTKLPPRPQPQTDILARKSVTSKTQVPGTGDNGVQVRQRAVSELSMDAGAVGSFSKQVGKASAISVAAGPAIQAPPAGAGPMSNMVLMGPSNIKKSWVESDDELDDLGLDDSEEDELGTLAERVQANGSPQKASIDDIDLAGFEEGVASQAGDADVFADLEFDAPDPRVDEEARIARHFHRIITKLNPKEEEGTIIEACMALQEMVAEEPAAVTRQMTSGGVIPVMEMLEVPNPNVIVAVLKVVNLVIGQDQKFQQNMSLVGLIPAIIRFASPGFPSNIRLEAANFVRHFCYASDFTRKMFVACGGLPVLVGFLEDPYDESKTLVFNSIDCIRHVFEISSNPKNDFCRLFCKYGLLPPLAAALNHVNADSEHPDAVEYTQKIANVIHLFSNGDATVKQYMAKPQVMETLLHALPNLAHDVLNLILKSIRNISMEPSTLDLLASAGTIPALIPFLASQHADCQYQVLMAMYYLSRISNTRQEQLARSSVTPHLQRFISQNHPMKQFALPILIQLSKTSKVTRLELRKYNGVAFFLDLLQDSYWRTHALDSIALWLADDPRRVEFILIQSSNLIKLVDVLRKTHKPVQFEKILGPFCKILTASQAVNQTLGRNHAFVSEVVTRLQTHRDNNNIRMNLLKLLALLFDNHLTPNDFVERYQLVPVLEKVALDRSAVMVAPMARTLLRQMDPSSVQRIQAAEQPEVSVSEVDYR